MASEDIKSKFSGKWKNYKSENVEDFLKEIGMNVVKRKAAASMSPTQTITVDGDKVTIIIDATVKSVTETFPLNVEFEHKSDEGKNVKSIMTYADGKLKVVNTPTDSKKNGPVTVVREICGDDLLMTLSCNGVVAKRYFKKQ